MRQILFKRHIPKNLFLRIAIGTAVSVVVLGVAANYALRVPIEGQIREEAVRDAVSHIQPLTLRTLSPEALAAPVNSPQYQELDRLVRDLFLSSDIAWVKIWDANRTVIYSSLDSQVGEARPSNAKLEMAFGGEAAWELEDASEDLGDTYLGDVLEVYIPISWRRIGPPDLVVEVYMPYAPYAALVSSIRNAILIATLMASVVVGGVIYSTYLSRWRAVNRERLKATQRAEELEAIGRATNAMVQPGHIQDKISNVMNELVDISQAHSALFRVPADNDGTLEMAVAAIEPKDAPTDPLPVLGSGGLATLAYETRKPVIANDYPSHPLAVRAMVEDGTESAIVLPINYEGRCLGTISILSKQLGHFTEERVRLLETIVNGLGAHIEQARLQEEMASELEEERKRLTTFQEIAGNLAIGADPDPNQALQNMLDAACSLLEAQYGSLCVWDQAGNLTINVLSGLSIGEQTRIGQPAQGNGLLSVVRDGQQPVRLSDISSHPQAVGFPPNHPKLKTLLATPLSLRDEKRGAIYLANTESGEEFSEDDQRILAFFAILASALLDNVSLYRAVVQESGMLTAVQSSITEGLAVFDSHGREVFRNRTMEQLTGLTGEATLGKSLPEALISRKDYYFEDPETLSHLLEALANVENGPTTVEVVMVSPQRRVLSATVFPIPLESGDSMGGILLRDITQERDLERRRDEFVSIASHELRTPMTTVLGFAELLLLQDPPKEKREEWLQRIIGDSRRLTDIIDDMLNVSRIQSARLHAEIEAVDMQEVVQGVVKTLEPTTSNHNIVVSISPRLPRVLADRDKLAQVYMNLLSNAIKYSPNGGTIRFGAEYHAQGHRVITCVADEGMGIAPDDLEKLFTSFSRIRRPETQNIKGTGLGLYIVKGLVELMDGQIWVESELNKGSTFYVSLPAVPEDDDTTTLEPISSMSDAVIPPTLHQNILNLGAQPSVPLPEGNSPLDSLYTHL